jgi:hypothetical protein
LSGPDLVPQIKDGVSKFANHTSDLSPQLFEKLALFTIGCHLRDVVHKVAKRRYVLRHTIVHLAGEPLAFIARRGVPDVTEQQSSVELEHGRAQHFNEPSDGFRVRSGDTVNGEEGDNVGVIA